MNQLFTIDINTTFGNTTLHAFGTEKDVTLYAERQATSYGGTAKTYPIQTHTCYVPFKDVAILT